MNDRIAQLLADRRWCYWIPPGGFIEGHGFRVSVVIENELGHYPTGDLDFDKPATHVQPWFWGMTYSEAEHVAAETNANRLQLDEATIVKILRSAGVI